MSIKLKKKTWILHLVGVRKNICTAHFPDTHKLHSRSKQMCVYSPWERFCSRDVESSYLLGA